MERTRDILFAAAIGAHLGHLQSILLLGAVALVDEDADPLSANIDELSALRSTTSLSDAEQADIGGILRAAGAVMDSNPDAAVLAKIQSDVVLFPGLPARWSRLPAANGG